MAYENRRLREQLEGASAREVQLQRQADEQLLQLMATQREVAELASQVKTLAGAGGLKRQPAPVGNGSRR